MRWGASADPQSLLATPVQFVACTITVFVGELLGPLSVATGALPQALQQSLPKGMSDGTFNRSKRPLALRYRRSRHTPAPCIAIW
jgi:hypothetical protein